MQMRWRCVKCGSIEMRYGSKGKKCCYKCRGELVLCSEAKPKTNVEVEVEQALAELRATNDK